MFLFIKMINKLVSVSLLFAVLKIFKMCFIFYLELTNELTNVSFCLGSRYDPVVIVDDEPLGSYNNPIVVPDDIPPRRSPRLAARSRTSSPSPSTSAPITITSAQTTTQVTTDSDPAATF